MSSSAPPFSTGSSPSNPPSKRGNRVTMPLITVLLIIAFVGGLLLSAWYFQLQLQKIQPQKHEVVKQTIAFPTTLLIGTDATFPPMEFINKQGGLIGYDIDFGYRIANELGIKAKFVNTKWDDIFTSLESKKVDVIISSVSITEERKHKYLFSQPYLNAGQVILTQRGNNTINVAKDLKNKKVGVQKGTTDEQEAMKYTSDNLIIRYDDYNKATKALVDGQVDAILSDLTGAKGIITDNPTLRIASDPLTNEYYGVVLRKEELDLQNRIDEVISSLQTKGFLADLKQKWLD